MKCLLTLVFTFHTLTSFASESPSFIKSCQKAFSKNCQRQIIHDLNHYPFWGNLTTNYLQAKKLWRSDLIIELSQDLQTQGDFKAELRNKKLVPVLTIPQNNDVYEFLITLNHEIVHFNHSQNFISLIYNNQKLNNCLSSYQLAQLKDESSAFSEEINFWEKSPQWFKDHFLSIKFDSALLEGRFSYHEYYTALKNKIQTDTNWILKRYILLKHYPNCTNDLLVQH